MALKKTSIIILGMLIINSCCSGNETKELEDRISELSNINLSLKKELDSIKFTLENENFEPYVFNNSYYYDSNNLDSLNFLVCLGYNRPSYSRTIYLDIFTNEDSLDFANENPDSFNYQYQFDLQDEEKPETGLQVRLPNVEADFVVVAGHIKITSIKGVKYFPFQYDIEYWRKDKN